MSAPSDDELAARHGAYASFQTEGSPASVDYYGESPADEVARLLRLHARADGRALTIGGRGRL